MLFQGIGEEPSGAGDSFGTSSGERKGGKEAVRIQGRGRFPFFHTEGIAAKGLQRPCAALPLLFRALERMAGKGQGGGRSGMDAGTGQYAGPAVGALQRRGRTRIAWIEP